MAFKVYTKTGDKGQTSLLGGTRLPKHHIRIEAYGTVDELNSYIGLVRDQAIDANSKAVLVEIQDRLFTLGSLLAADPKKNKMKLPEVKEEDVTYLEQEIDKMDEVLPEMKHFVLPGKYYRFVLPHRALCVPQAERATLKLSENEEVDAIIVKYLNRLSDYLFVLSRKLAMDSNAEEIPWKPRV